MRRILLVEPAYKNKYPPMGLMKISSYHKMMGDYVRFVKGTNSIISSQIWDRIYITSLFTFDFKITVNTINHYKLLVNNTSNIFIGGIMASLIPESIIEATGLLKNNIVKGLLTDSSMIGDRKGINIDLLPLDYDILEDIKYKYPAGDNYFSYMTRGCPNNCDFCAVPDLEPCFHVTTKINEQLSFIDNKYGSKRNLILLDNNILNAPDLSSLVNDLCEAGFARGAKYIDKGDFFTIIMRYRRGDRADFLDNKMKNYLNYFKKRIKLSSERENYINILLDCEDQEDFASYILLHEKKLTEIIEKYQSRMPKSRYLDFNQGIDVRRINDETMTQLARLSIRPLRIAFDEIKFSNIYKKAVKTAFKHGIREISNYILFNYNDKPEDLYERLRINIELNQELGIQIFSFPMKYSPTDRIDRNYVGKYWNLKQIRAISAILHVTKGVVAAGTGFFYKAFGENLNKYFELLDMPREMIMYRYYFEGTGDTLRWQHLYNSLNAEQKKRLLELIVLNKTDLKNTFWPNDLEEILSFYMLKYPRDNDYQISIYDN